jgi:hypothetical protein
MRLLEGRLVARRMGNPMSRMRKLSTRRRLTVRYVWPNIKMTPRMAGPGGTRRPQHEAKMSLRILAAKSVP